MTAHIRLGIALAIVTMVSACEHSDPVKVAFLTLRNQLVDTIGVVRLNECATTDSTVINRNSLDPRERILPLGQRVFPLSFGGGMDSMCVDIQALRARDSVRIESRSHLVLFNRDTAIVVLKAVSSH